MTALLLLESVTVFENEPLIWLPLESSTWNPEIGPVLIAVPALPLGSVPMLNVAGGVPLGDAVGGVVGGDVGKVGIGDGFDVAPVGATVGPPDGELTGLADDEPLGIDEGTELGNALEPPALLDVGVGPADELDIGCPPGELLGAVDGTTPPV